MYYRRPHVSHVVQIWRDLLCRLRQLSNFCNSPPIAVTIYRPPPTGRNVSPYISFYIRISRTCLVLVIDSGEQLRVSKSKKKSHSIWQSIPITRRVSLCAKFLTLQSSSFLFFSAIKVSEGKKKSVLGHIFSSLQKMKKLKEKVPDERRGVSFSKRVATGWLGGRAGAVSWLLKIDTQRLLPLAAPPHSFTLEKVLKILVSCVAKIFSSRGERISSTSESVRRLIEWFSKIFHQFSFLLLSPGALVKCVFVFDFSIFFFTYCYCHEPVTINFPK